MRAEDKTKKLERCDNVVKLVVDQLWTARLYAFNFKFLRRNIMVDSGKWIKDSASVFCENVKLSPP